MGTDINNLERRTVLTGAAWSVPVVALAVAAPSAAASTSTQVDLTSTARLPREAPDGTHLSDDFYQGPRTLSFRASYTNNGPAELPTGAIIEFGLPFAMAWDTASLAIIEDPNGMTPAAAGTSTVDISTADGPAAFRQVWSFVLSAPVPAGTTFDIVYQVDLNGISNTATNHYRVRVYTNINVGTTGAEETVLDNNAGFSAFAFFNNENAG